MIALAEQAAAGVIALTIGLTAGFFSGKILSHLLQRPPTARRRRVSSPDHRGAGTGSRVTLEEPSGAWRITKLCAPSSAQDCYR